MAIVLGQVKISNITAAGAVNIAEIDINSSMSLMNMSGGAGSFNNGDLNIINNHLSRTEQISFDKDFINKYV